MKKKLISVVILTIIVLSSIIIPKIYADMSEIVGVPNTNVKVGKQAKVYLNLENISGYTLSKIVLITDIYIEPILDTANTNLTKDDMVYDANKKEFTISNISNEIKTLSVSYTIPQYIAVGTKIKLTVIAYGYKGTETELGEQYKKTFEIAVIGEDTNTPNNNDNKNTNNDSGNNTTKPNDTADQNNTNTRKYV